ncbi:hypothetical protein EDD15DRAFT_793261 [Pisolithus albus]|nr:hypothetical protein EDD15DRAFT_793261 [Pisolithus albus]
MQGCLRGTRGTWCGRSLDLADHMFGDLVTTSLARDILQQFLADGIVTCEDNNPGDGNATPLALTTAYDDAVAHAFNAPPDKSTPEPKTRYRWGWREFPTTPIDKNELVVFLNSIADIALSFTGEIRKDDPLQPKNRFAASVDKHHAIPLSYESDGEEMRPDFMVLPLTAFSDERVLELKEAHVNFTTMLLVGESKSASNARDGITRVQRYIGGSIRARSWLKFAIGMSVGKDLVTLLRADNSGIERIEMTLTDGRGCIEFIRTILGIVLADEKEFGRNPEIDIEEKDVSLDVYELSTANTGTNTATSGTAPATPHAAPAAPPTSSGRRSSRTRNPTARSNPPSVNQPSATSSTGITSDNTATGSKRGPDDEKSPEKGSKKQKRTVVFRAFVPARVYGRECAGVLFTSASIRGRGTTVYVVEGVDSGQKYSALKTSWLDVHFADRHAAVLAKLSRAQPHDNVIIPKELLDHKENSTLGSIRGFLGDEIQKCSVENRILTVTTSNLQRPVAYFWSPHDFVRGMIGALLGHEYLWEIGILHCDISENNIVLSLHPGGFGALIDFDMAIVRPATMPTPLPAKSVREVTARLVGSEYRPPERLPASDEEAQRTGTTPYMSIGVLRGKPHTHFDDIESFLYVLVLFFLSYKGPLTVDELKQARGRGFIQPVGMGRLPHITTWPAMIGQWRSGTVKEMSKHKAAILGAEHREEFITDCLPHIRSRWEPVSQSTSIAVSTLVSDCWMTFSLDNRKVTHSGFVGVLKAWLDEYKGEEANYKYPFE